MASRLWLEPKEESRENLKASLLVCIDSVVDYLASNIMHLLA